MKDLMDYEFLNISELQKMTSKKLARLTRRPVVITERSKPRYVLLAADNSFLKGGNYRYLVSRNHPWKKQMFIKGRNMTVGHLVYTMRKERMTAEEAALDFDLPMDTVLEALHYFEHNWRLIEMEALEEKRRLADEGLIRAA